MRNQEWDSLAAQLDALDLAQLILRLFIRNAVDGIATLDIVDKAEVLASLLEADDIHEACWVGGVGADLAVDLDQALHENLLYFPAIEGIFQAIPEEDDEG